MSTLRRLQNFWMLWVTTMVLVCFSDGFAQASYKVTDLGALKNDNLGMTMGLNNHGASEIMDQLVDPFSLSLSATVVQGSVRINMDDFNIDLGTLGGKNSSINWGGINDRWEAVGMSETSVPDPDGEDVCGFGTGLTCLPFLWRHGHMSALPTVGGNNGQASAINNRGQIAGYAETAVVDSACPPFKTTLPVLWKKGQAQALPTVGSDPDGVAFGINDQGQAVGYSGTCIAALHAVLWQNGSAVVLPDLGVPRSNSAFAINNQGQIVGQVRSADGTTKYAALWPNPQQVINLNTLPGDFAAFATGINDRGQVVGSTLTFFDSSFHWSHGFIYQNGVMTDLNTLFPADSNLFVISASNINNRGQISGMALVLSGPHANQEVHAFLATPVDEDLGRSVADVARTLPKITLPANVGKQVFQRFRPGRFER